MPQNSTDLPLTISSSNVTSNTANHLNVNQSAVSLSIDSNFRLHNLSGSNGSINTTEPIESSEPTTPVPQTEESCVDSSPTSNAGKRLPHKEASELNTVGSQPLLKIEDDSLTDAVSASSTSRTTPEMVDKIELEQLPASPCPLEEHDKQPLLQ
jgi:hypothetical protein